MAYSADAFGQGVPPKLEPRPPEEAPQIPATTPSPLEVPAVQLPGNAPPGAEQVRFTLTDIVVEGATVYPPDSVRQLYADRIGQPVTLQEIFDIAAALETRYRDDGYILTRVTVPPQRIEDGRVHLRVIEGYISEVKVSGDVGPVRDLIQGYVDKITESRPARLEDIERYLLLANDVPGITALGVMQPTTAADGATQLIVNVERDWFSGYARIDNRESDFTGPWRIIAAPGTNSITSLGERLQVTGLTTFDLPEEQYVGLAATGHVGSEGLQLGATFSYEETHPGSSFKVFDIDTNALRFGLAADYPLVRSRRTNLYLGGGFDYADIDTELGPVTIAGFTFSGATHDRLRVVWAGVRADHRDEWGGANLLEVHLRQGLPGLGSTESDDVEKSRVDADGTFTSFQLTAARRQRITDTLNLYLGGKAQLSADPLLADEECSVGGEIYGRGYDPGEIADDDCLAGTVELQYNPEWRPDFLKNIVSSYQVYGFYDVGRVWPEDGDFGDGEALQSAGIGVRTQFWDWLRVDLEVAKPLTRDRSFESNDTRAPQFYLGATTQF